MASHRLWGSQVMLMSLDLPAKAHVNPDQWDGYGAERAEMLKHFRGSGVKNLAVLSGDIHTIFAGDLTTSGDVSGDPIGVEFGGGSMTSLGIPESVGIAPSVLAGLMPAADPHIKYADFEHRGYGVATATRNDLKYEVKGVESTFTPSSRAKTLAKFRVAAGTPELIGSSLARR